MKKFILPLLLILAVGMLAAVESEPSEVVGYFKKTINAGSYEAFSLPFAYDNMNVSSVIGNQFSENDYILDMNTGLSTTYYGSEWGWFGDFDLMEYGHAYWIYRDIVNPTTVYYLLGKVDPQISNIIINGQDMGGWTPFAINEAAEVAIGNLYLPNIQYEDFIIDIQTGFISTYYGPEWGWFSGDGFDYILPTHTYWLYTTSPTSSAWTYTPIRETKNANNELQNTKRSKK